MYGSGHLSSLKISISLHHNYLPLKDLALLTKFNVVQYQFQQISQKEDKDLTARSIDNLLALHWVQQQNLKPTYY